MSTPVSISLLLLLAITEAMLSFKRGEMSIEKADELVCDGYKMEKKGMIARFQMWGGGPRIFFFFSFILSWEFIRFSWQV